MKTGLVLEGGAMRGLYTAGVLDVFLDNDISFDGLIGVSAGTIHGCSYVSKQNGRSIRYYTKYSKMSAEMKSNIQNIDKLLTLITNIWYNFKAKIK